MAMENEKCDPFLYDLLKRVIEAEGFTGDPKITVNSGSGIGDGFHSNNSAVEIQDDDKVLKLFVKAPTRNESIRSQTNADSLFAREIHFYETIYPTFLKFQMKHNVKQPFTNVPKCYLTSAENLHEVLILENLKEHGYTPYNKKFESNDQVITSAFKLYARFHAVSYAMKDQEPDLYAKLIDNMDDFFWTFFKTAGIDVAFTQLSEEAKALFDPVKDPYVSNRIKNLTEVLMNFLSTVDKNVDDYSVITHGDSWFNNFLFKYEDDQNGIKDMKILDWQIMRVNSPILDLSYFFYGIAGKANLVKLDVYLKIYYDTLSCSITELGSDPVRLYPYHLIRGHWKKFSRFGLLLSFAIQKALLMEKGEMPNPDETVNSGKSYGDAFKMPEIGNEDLYKERIRDIIRHFVDNDFL